MEQTSVQRLARVLRVLVIMVFICNIIALFLVPMAIHLYDSDLSWPEAVRNILDFTLNESIPEPLGVFVGPVAVLVTALRHCISIWRVPYFAVLVLFLWLCGGCTAGILWQGKRVLDTILKGTPFSLDNAQNLKRAAVCCFLISGAAFLRLVWLVSYVRNIDPFFTYNALFAPIFLMGGLLFMVMSALFRQAAELKAENDLTI